MNRFKNRMIIGAVFALLATIGAIMNLHQVKAQGPPGGVSVSIVNPVPVPVTGSTTVSGTVGIAGTPNVKVTNPATAPMFVLHVNDPGRVPYQSVVSGNINSCVVQNLCLGVFPTVPSGHRLVIQHASIQAALSTGATTVFVVLGDNFSNFSATILPSANGLGLAIVDQAVLAYFDAGQKPQLGIDSSSAVINRYTVSLTGYMLDCTIAPCAAIAQ